ncbi:MAG TPA: DUF5996 family protein [Gemmatimonadaceae bacterium]|jgi:hypothetical protein
MLPSTTHDPWPALPLREWQDTYATLHRWLQVVGKTRLALAPRQNHWWHVALYLTSRGLATSPMPIDDRTFELELDFLDHQLVARTSDGDTRTLPLAPRSVADFYRDYIEMLRSLEVAPRIWPVPVEIADATPFLDDRAHASYDADAAQRCWRILVSADELLKEFRGWFIGKSSPSHFFWGSFDLACTRFSGRGAPLHPGGIPNCPDYVAHEAYSHECISAGWWPGALGSPIEEPAFYAYAYPEPVGCPDAAIRPSAAAYNTNMREWILPYEAVRSSSDPKKMVMEFLQSTYEAAATRGAWSAELERDR